MMGMALLELPAEAVACIFVKGHHHNTGLGHIQTVYGESGGVLALHSHRQAVVVFGGSGGNAQQA